MFEYIVPPGTSTFETFEPLIDEPLFASEEALVTAVRETRQQEFRSVRSCARKALAVLQIERPPLLPDRAGAPSWPRGVVGSMTHCPGLHAAAVAPGVRFRSLGIDAEVNAQLPAGVLSVVATPGERAHVQYLRATDGAVAWDRLLFSAKESVYKAWYSLTRQSLPFNQFAICLNRGGTFSVTFRDDGPDDARRDMSRSAGGWLAHGGLLATGIAVRPLGAPRC